MLTFEELEAIRRANHWKDYQQETHYIQGLSLFLLRDAPLVFKGGTCMWYFYGLPRYSDDLDFTSSGIIPEDLYEKLSLDLVKVFGVENQIFHGGKFKEARSYRIDAHGPFFNPTRRGSGLRYVKVEISDREQVLLEPNPGMLNHPEYLMPPSVISCMAVQEMCCEKVRATMTREKARDVFDLWYMITRLGVFFDEEMINIKLSVARKKYDHDLFVEAVKKKETSWLKDLKPIVFGKLPSFKECADVVFRWAAGYCK